MDRLQIQHPQSLCFTLSGDCLKYLSGVDTGLIRVIILPMKNSHLNSRLWNLVSNYSGRLLYCSTGTVRFQTREFFQLTFHLVQYKIFQDVAVKVQLVCNCTSSLGQTKAKKDFFFSPHIFSVLQRSSNWFTSFEHDEFNPIGKSRTWGRRIYH